MVYLFWFLPWEQALQCVMELMVGFSHLTKKKPGLKKFAIYPNLPIYLRK